ncbi:hypothetical protein TOT_020000761 [Theileria orientalis strain Shintoku]|uniref:Uncharacterized protein n=1 Tax=Theileria orientalis strain Shintoku TaxID=869250 RepID=J4C3I6_THEOR|nr:hypothetical protein TOT_020000761 [Theileria orientalis strain Shintoku]BAM40506.1 hypothetical protein TOT_020000761 [Theileria orientalis strain Shintoku]|eukprot:XP_009690807.1 hypothetical protein TOT_020000761 [Theileria orientalis strain Shintoku]
MRPVLKDSLPKIDLDLTITKTYRQGHHYVKVYQLRSYGHYPVFTQIYQKDGPFDIGTVKVDGEHRLKIDKKNVSMVTVYYGEKNRIVMFETLYYSERNMTGSEMKLVHRYHARDPVTNASVGQTMGGDKDSCWREYMYKDNDTIEMDNFDRVIDALMKNKRPLNRIDASGIYFQIVRTHEHRDKICGYCKPVENQVTQEEIENYDDIEAQIVEEEGGFFEFFTSSNGMVTAVATGSVGGAAIGGTLIYMVAS